MIRWVKWEELEQSHLVALANSLMATPIDKRADVGEIMERLRNGSLRAFSWGPKSILVVGQGNGTLVIEACTGDIFKRRELATDLKRLAADWECDTIETLVFDSRLARAIEKIGGQCESWLMTLAVEG